MNWGHKIIISLVTFMILTLVMVFIAVKQKDISLVSENYYEDELAYQQIIDKMNNVNNWEHEIKLHLKPNERILSFEYPEGVKLNGSIRFFRPSDEHQDFVLAMNIDDQFQSINWQGRSKGLWKIIMQWESNGVEFYKEEKIVIP